MRGWSAGDLDGDVLTYRIEFSADSGNTWQILALDWPSTNLNLSSDSLKGTSSGLIRVVASDGFRTAADQSDNLFQVPNQAPTAKIRLPSDRAFFSQDQPIFFEGFFSDREDSTLGTNQTRWFSDRDGLISSGTRFHRLAHELSEGPHSVSFVVRDTGGLEASNSVQILISRIPPPRLELLSHVGDGRGSFFVVAHTNGTHSVQVSTNLLSWSDVVTNTNTVGLFQFIETNADSAPIRFFRAVTRP